jgi:hypothetical protein
MAVSVDMQGPGGFSVKKLPVELLGWFIMAALCAFMVYKMAGSYEEKLDSVVKETSRQTIILERILEEVKK